MRLSKASRIALVNTIALWLTASSSAQAPAPAHDDSGVTASLNELQSEVHELKDLVQQLKQESVASRAEMTRLRQELESERTGMSSASGTSPVDMRVGQLEDEQQMLSG